MTLSLQQASVRLREPMAGIGTSPHCLEVAENNVEAGHYLSAHHFKCERLCPKQRSSYRFLREGLQHALPNLLDRLWSFPGRDRLQGLPLLLLHKVDERLLVPRPTVLPEHSILHAAHVQKQKGEYVTLAKRNQNGTNVY